MAKLVKAGEGFFSVSAAVTGIIIARYYPAFGIASLAFLLVAFLVAVAAAASAYWYIKVHQGKVNKRLLSVLAWLNLAAWIIPYLGIFAGMATYRLNVESKDVRRSRYMKLAAIGVTLSLINALANIILVLNHIS